MKKICKNLFVAAIICCLVLSLAACGNSSTPAKTEKPTQTSAPALDRYDYVADMNGNTTNITIAKNLKSVSIEIKSMGLKLTAYCTVEDGVLTLTERVEGNEQFYAGLSKTPYVLNADGTAVPKQ